MTDLSRVLRSNLRLRHLQLLVALDQFRHLGRAAGFLSLTQPAVSKTLAEIERLFGVPLFTRSTRGTEPTAYGESVVRFARGVIADYERTRDELAAVAAGAAGRVRVGAMGVAGRWVARAVTRFKAGAPQATVLVEEGDLMRLLPRLRLGELDLIAGRLEPGYAAPDLVTEPLADEPMVLVVAPGHALARRRRPGWAEVAACPCVLPPPYASLRVKLDQQFHRHGLHPPADVIESASYRMQLAFLHERRAVGVLARGEAQHAQAQGLLRVLPIAVDVELPPVGLVSLRGRSASPGVLQLAQALRSELPFSQKTTIHR
ncbi:MAG: LysR substrate-binding domain-containing protein [Rubrivivax sp.]